MQGSADTQLTSINVHLLVGYSSRIYSRETKHRSGLLRHFVTTQIQPRPGVVTAGADLAAFPFALAQRFHLGLLQVLVASLQQLLPEGRPSLHGC